MVKRLFSAPVVLALLSVAVVGFLAWPYSVDDAYIVARYAVRIVEGEGYSMIDGGPTDGITGPLWLVPAIGAYAFGYNPVFANKAVGLFCAMSAVYLLLVWIRSRAQGRAASWFASVVIASQPTIGIWAVAGLETGAATLAVVVALLAASHRPRPRPIMVGAAIASLAWLRPEMALFSAVVLVGLTFVDRKSGIIASGIATLSLFAVIVFRLLMFGTILPIAYHAKPGPLSNGLQYTATAMVTITGGVGIWLAWRGATKGRATDLMIGIAIVAHLMAVILAGGDWMPGFRLLAPVLPVYGLLVAFGVVGWLHTRTGRIVAIFAVLFACLIPFVNAVVQLPEVRLAGQTRMSTGKRFAQWLSRNTQRIALVDVGYLAYESKVEVIDLGGVTDPVVAKFPGGHTSKRFDIGYLQSRNPDAIVLHSIHRPVVSQDGRLLRLSGFPVERNVAASAWVRDRFRVIRIVEYSRNYFYAVLKNRSGL